MRPSLHGGGKMLPESWADFQELLAAGGTGLEHIRCMRCREGFSEGNVRTPAGWRETQISGMCENCFDELFKED